ncbi:hypothetical protein [Mycoplasma putrefaciens]|uniref:Transmembrane protein n=2 Tax=Mycoplasma putrefaciens TaxID=2123 RepID=M9WGN5_9MOLU|nr:hypothetical protein [Mycoplasma putrefaciens]AEM68897.1 uncharacterized protein MPUT_0542 [Mycoplasma putrefaciens KS1]AGJ90615.1 Hypothetical protein, predicted transmembrane protein [Mycoplasma putrefaciens Mput9231]
MFYGITTGISVLVLIGLIVLAIVLDRNFFKRISTTTITLMAMLVALIVLLTNCIGNSGILGARLMLGNFVLFLSGMLLGPVGGAVVGVLSWIIGLAFIQTYIHTSILAMYVLYAMLGSFVFLLKPKSRFQFVYTTVVLLFIAMFLMTFIAFPIAQWSFTTKNIPFLAVVLFPKKFIVFPIDVVFEIVLVFACFQTALILLKNSPNIESKIWALKKTEGQDLFRKKNPELQQ